MGVRWGVGRRRVVISGGRMATTLGTILGSARMPFNVLMWQMIEDLFYEIWQNLALEKKDTGVGRKGQSHHGS